MQNASLDLLRKMRLHGMADAYESLLHLPVNQQPQSNELLALLSDAEMQYRTNKKMELYLKRSKLRYPAVLADISCSEARNLSKNTLTQLSDNGYLNRGENIFITGATGCGKSYLACALGHHACVLGYQTLYFNMNVLTEQIALAKSDGTLVKWYSRMKRAKLLILDDFGLQALPQSVKMALLQIFEDRYEKSATIICSQLPIKAWHKYINEPTIADAILDRIVPKAHRIELKGKSLRKKVKALN